MTEHIRAEVAESEPRVIARGTNPDKATLIAVLLTIGLWDRLTPDDREAWCERAEIRDTAGGMLLFSSLRSIGVF